MKQNKKEKHINVNLRKSKKIKVILPIIIILLLILGVITFAYSKNINLTKSNNEEQEVEEEKAQEIVLEDNKYMHLETDANGDKVPVPNGFVGSKATGENEIDTGFVIYEGEEVVNDGNVETAQTSRNQYVWIPVYDISKFYGTDANGKKWGKIYQFSTSTSSSYDQVTGTRPYNWSENSEGIMSIDNATNYREPDVVVRGSSSTTTTGYDMDSRLKTLGLGAETTHELLFQLEKEFNKMIDSVEKYGGFYIGRYETGDLNQNVAVVQKCNTDISSQTWYTMYKKCKTLSYNNNNVVTGMARGNQFDRTLMWLMECNAKNPDTGKTKEEVIRDSTSWGNYYNATFEYTNDSGSIVTKNQNSDTKIPTGSTDYTKANNIYDLAGNVWDWTMETYSTSSRVCRGGHFNLNGTSYPARYRGSSSPDYSNINYGVRAALYIK